MAGIVFHELLGFRSEDAAALMQEAAARVSRESVPGLAASHARTARAVLRVAGAVRPDPRRTASSDPFARTTRAPRRVRGGNRVPRTRVRARVAQASSGWGSGIRHGCLRGRGPVEYLDRMGFLDDQRARGARRAIRRRRSCSALRRPARRSSPAREETFAPAPALRRSRSSSNPACASRSAPTASPAFPI